MNPRYQDGSFQTAADMLRNQQREFVELLMQQMSANLSETLAASISSAVGQAVQAAQNRDVRPRREQDYATNQHKLLLTLCPEVQTLLRKNTTRRSRVAWTSTLHSKPLLKSTQNCREKRQLHRDLQSAKE